MPQHGISTVMLRPSYCSLQIQSEECFLSATTTKSMIRQRLQSLEDGLTYQKQQQNYFEAETPTTQLEETEGVTPTQLPLNPGYQAIQTLPTNSRDSANTARRDLEEDVCMTMHSEGLIDRRGNAGWHLSKVDGRRWTSVDNSRVFENGEWTFWCGGF